METKEFKVQVPAGYEIDAENSTFECIKFKPIKKLTYDDVAKELFEGNTTYYIDEFGNVMGAAVPARCDERNNCTSLRQALKLLAINKLLNTARFLNGKWQPFSSEYERPYFIDIDTDTDEIECDWEDSYNSRLVYFKTKELAQQAIDILGEDTIRLALSTDW